MIAAPTAAENEKRYAGFGKLRDGRGGGGVNHDPRVSLSIPGSLVEIRASLIAPSEGVGQGPVGVSRARVGCYGLGLVPRTEVAPSLLSFLGK